jgi:hypothetical protein
MIMKNYWIFCVTGLIMVGNFVLLMMYGNTLRSTHLFIVRGTVFFPLAYLNLVSGIVLLSVPVLNKYLKRRK